MPEQPAPGLVDTLCTAQRIVVLTGAGVSAESGVPTFRDAQTGLWANYDPQQLATPGAFESDPKTAWAWYRWRRELVSNAAPNEGHRALAAMQQALPALTLITQNVDGLHTQAGSSDVIEFHGNLFTDKCTRDGRVFDAQDAADQATPRCPECDWPLTPGVVLFGEQIPQHALSRAFEATEVCNMFICIGTSSMVYPAAGLAELAVSNGATLLEINIEDTPLTPLADHVLRGSSATILPDLLARISSTNQAH